MTTIPKIDTMDSEIEINGVTVEMVYSYTDEGEDGSRWINGRATVAGKSIGVGGGWVDEDGDV